MKLEKMGEFFDHRLEGYEEHQLNCIESAPDFYRETARQLPDNENAKILDLGCGTGLELNEYFRRNPNAEVTGIDLAEGMLQELQKKFMDKKLILKNASYFDVPFGHDTYDAVVSVESLHHFTMEQKIPLYRKIWDALHDGGYFVLTDYMVESEDNEQMNFEKLEQLKKDAGINDSEFYHYDTPLTREHEKQALLEGGFSEIDCLQIWGNTTLLKAYK